MANPSLQIGNSNWAIKEDNLLGYSTAGTRFVPQPITMTRASAGTRVNSSGLVETVELLGSDVVINGDFDTDTDWTKGAGWTISGGNLNASNVNAVSTTQAGYTFVGKTFQVSYTISDYSQGSVQIYLGGSQSTSLKSENGTHTETISISSGNTTLYIYGTSNFTGSIDNISVKESTKNNLARVDYDGTASSLLVEPERTNLITYSEELQSTTNVTLSNTISPDGTLNGLKINETTSNSQHYATSYSAAVVSGTIYTVSFYIKKGTYDLVKVYTQSSRISASINITFSTESTSASGSDFISGSNFMEDAGNGWYRVGFSATANSTGEVKIYLSIKDLSTYVGDISQYTEYWGASLEAGSYATSYIPTDGGTVTRVQDQYSKTGISNLINSTEGVLYWEGSTLINGGGDNRIISLSDGTNNNLIYIRIDNTASRFRGYARGSSGSYTLVTVNSIPQTDNNKIALVWDATNFIIWINGSKRSTTTINNSPVGMNTLNLSSPTGSDTFFGKVKQLQVFKTALTDSELATLTT